ncbi:MAG: glycosyltransferase family 39 protein [Ilumatobacteraceae bacterium]
MQVSQRWMSDRVPLEPHRVDVGAMIRRVLPVYLVSRACVLAGAAVVAAELRADQNLAAERMLDVGDPHATAPVTTATRPMLDVLTSWDGLWYLELVRSGYPRSVPPNVSYHVDEARAAFFPLFPLLGRFVDRILPGGDTTAVLILNALLGFVVVVLVGLIGQRLYGQRIGTTAATLTALFPGSFVLSFAYSEALMMVLAAGCLWCLVERDWGAAGVLAALATATRPNGVALVAACAVAALFAIADRREWRALLAPALAPVGFVVFQLWLGRHTDEPGVWFRVQREAWDEGASFGWTALSNTVHAVVDPLTSPTDTVTALSLAALVVLLFVSWRARLPLLLSAYSWGIVVLMLVPATVTARPRFIFTAFPLFIGAAKWFEERRSTDGSTWTVLCLSCGAGLAAVTALYGVFGAIP